MVGKMDYLNTIHTLMYQRFIIKCLDEKTDMNRTMTKIIGHNFIDKRKIQSGTGPRILR